MANIYLIYLCAILLFLGKIQCDDNIFNHEEEDFINEDANVAHSRLKRADVSAIQHLYDESRIDEHSQEEKDAILAKHREYRSRTSPEASNMEYMYWNEDLARDAALWASVCHWGHGRINNTQFPDSGQNLWLGGDKPAGDNAVIAWHDSEIGHYNYEDNSCSVFCGHYTQIVWAKSIELGCGRAFCSEFIEPDGNIDGFLTNKWIEACHYDPGGNYAGTKPFQSGSSCTECQSGSGQCYNKACRPCSEHSEACDCRQTCYNCGTLTSDCKCECMKGWYGSSCSSYCENIDDRCGNGWPDYYCDQYPQIIKKCPLLCGICEPAGDEVCGTTKTVTTAPSVTTQSSGETEAPDTTTKATEATTTSSTTTESSGATKAPNTTTKAPEVTTTSSATTESSGCKQQCKNKGTLQKDCTCKCRKDYTGKRCERLIQEVENGVEILFVEDISQYTNQFETKLRKTVATLVTAYCNDNLQTCCFTDKDKSTGTFEFIDYQDVITAQGYPIEDDTEEPAFVTMVIITMPSTTDLCENGTQSTERRKRDVDLILHRHRRADEVGMFFDQDILVEVIQTNMATIENDLNVTVGEIRAGSVTKVAAKRIHPGKIAGVIVAVLLAVIIITVIVVVVVKNSNSRKNKTENRQDTWANKKRDVAEAQEVPLAPCD